MNFWRRPWNYFLLCVLFASVAVVPARAEREPERVKAVLFYQLSRYFNGFDFLDEFGYFNYCIWGESPFDGFIREMRGLTMHGHRVRLQYPETLQQLRSCNSIYIGVGKVVPEALRTLPVLTVSDTSSEVVVKFIVRNRRLRFQYRDDMARRHGLKARQEFFRLLEEHSD